MKKNLLAIFAIVLAVGLSAFTTNHHRSHTKVDNPFWYSYNPSNNTLTGFIGQESLEDLEDNTNCKDEVDPVCAKGYASSQGTSFPIAAPSGATDVRTKRTP